MQSEPVTARSKAVFKNKKPKIAVFENIDPIQESIKLREQEGCTLSVVKAKNYK